MDSKFRDRKKKIAIDKINLIEFLDFYNKISQYKYSYTLEDERKINLSFQENNFPHLVGLHKFKKIMTYEKQADIIRAIRNNEINIEILKFNENKKLEAIKDRLGYFPCLNFLLENADTVIEFDATKCIPTTLKATFLLSTQKIRVAVFLAVRKIKDDVYDCVPVSFIVDRVNKYQIDKQEKFKIINYKKIEK